MATSRAGAADPTAESDDGARRTPPWIVWSFPGGVRPPCAERGLTVEGSYSECACQESVQAPETGVIAVSLGKRSPMAPRPTAPRRSALRDAQRGAAAA